MMPKRKAVDTLPDALRRQLDERLVANGFSDYVALSEWLASEGLSISKSALHVHGSELKAKHDDAMSTARELLALTRASGELGDAGAELSRHGAIILQTDIVKLSLEVRHEDDPEKRANLLSKLTRAHADIGRMVISAEKWHTEVKDKMNATLTALESQAAGGGKAGFDLATLKRVREEVYGII